MTLRRLLTAFLFALAATPAAAGAASIHRRPGHRVLLGAGTTFANESRFEGSVHPGAELGIDLALGGHVGIGVFWLTRTPFMLFADLRTCHIADMEATDFQQVMLRAGMAH